MRATLSLALFALCSSVAWGQATEGFGAVTGTVRDTAGEGIPDSTVLLSNDSLGLRRTLVTTDDGLFDAPALVPAPGYAIKIVRKGFVGWEVKDFQVFVGRKLEFNITLRSTKEAPNQLSDYILPAQVDDTYGVSGQVTPLQTLELPNSSHRWTALAALAPAAGYAPYGLLDLQGQPLMNSYQMDGVEVASTFFNERRAVARLFPEGAVQETGALVSDYGPEFAHSLGGVVGGVTHSGGNDFHGEFYDYLRTNALGAQDRFAAGRDLQQKRNQGGGGIGGPIFKNNLFFFASADVIDGHSQGLNRITSSLIADPTGSFVAASNCITPNSAAQCAAVTKFVQSQMNVIVPRTDRVVTGLARLDYRRRDRDAFTLEANYMKWNAPNGAQMAPVSPDGALLGDNGNYQQVSRFAKIAWVRALGTNVLNDIRIGWSKDKEAESPSPQLWPSTGAMGITVANATVGASALYPKWLNEERRQLVDNFTFTAGQHTMRTGIDYTKYFDFVDQLSAADGLYNYSTLGAFAQDLTGITNQRKNYSSFVQTFGFPQTAFSPRVLKVYLSDTWKLLPGFTFDYGLYFEKPKLPLPNWGNNDYPATGSINSPGLDFAPRVGGAYTMGEHTVARVSYGWFYAPFAAEALEALYLGGQSQTSTVSTQTGSPIFPNIYASESVKAKGSENLIYTSSKFRNPYSRQATAAIEHEFAAKTVVTLSVLDSQAMALLTANDLNLTTASTVTYTIVDAAGKTVNKWASNMYITRNDGRYAHIYQLENGGRSWYNAAMLQVRRPLSHGLALQLNYTFSHALDDVGNSPQGISLGSSVNNYLADKGSSASDQRQRATIDWIWRPTLSSASAPLRTLVNGWQLSGIATLTSARSATALILVSGQQFTSTTPAFANSLNGSGGWARVPFYPVNSLRMSPEQNLDARLARTFSFGERFKLTAMFQAFNVVNRQWTTGVNTVAFVAVSGLLKPVAGVGAPNASAVYDTSTARHCELALRLVF
jgi:hypothetical protein